LGFSSIYKKPPVGAKMFLQIWRVMHFFFSKKCCILNEGFPRENRRTNWRWLSEIAGSLVGEKRIAKGLALERPSPKEPSS